MNYRSILAFLDYSKTKPANTHLKRIFKSKLKIGFAFLIAFFSVSEVFAQGFRVLDYTVDITINEAGYFDVIEQYDLNFDESKHGIYRDIQTKYDVKTADGIQEKREINISNIKVPGYNFDVSSALAQRIEGKISIKIGDADKTLTGPQHYEIRYRVSKAFLYGDSLIYFYWNIKPTDWAAPFLKVNFRVHLPEDVTVRKSDCFVYSGTAGNTEMSSEFISNYANATFSANSKPGFVSYFGQSVTVLIKLPTESVAVVKPFWPFWTHFGWILILVALVIGFYALWRKYGKDDYVSTTTSYYPPDGMDPAMVGFLINDKDDTSDLISLIPYWASFGYLTIEEIPKSGFFSKSDTKLTMVKPIDPKAPLYQREIFTKLFNTDVPGDTILVSSLRNTFYTTMNVSRGYLRETAQKYYIRKSRQVKRIAIGVLILLEIILGTLFLIFWGLLAAIVSLLVTIFLLVMTQFLVKKNQLGNRLFSELKGFKQFIKLAEENKLKMLLRDDPGYFETTMSYALAFGLFDTWAKKFDALNVEPPKWYSSASGNAFMMSNFSQSFTSAMSSAQSTMVSSPSSSSSSGGGSSGGGFGGGGGGSW